MTDPVGSSSLDPGRITEIRERLIAAFRNTYAGQFPLIGDCCPRDGQGLCESCELLVEKALEALAPFAQTLRTLQQERETVTKLLAEWRRHLEDYDYLAIAPKEEGAHNTYFKGKRDAAKQIVAQLEYLESEKK